MRKLMLLDEQVCACKMATGRNAPRGVENVHTLCAGKPESDDRGNNMSVKRLDISLMFGALYKSGILLLLLPRLLLIMCR